MVHLNTAREGDSSTLLNSLLTTTIRIQWQGTAVDLVNANIQLCPQAYIVLAIGSGCHDVKYVKNRGWYGPKAS
jgi:hypothetical protein